MSLTSCHHSGLGASVAWRMVVNLLRACALALMYFGSVQAENNKAANDAVDKVAGMFGIGKK